MMESRTGHQQPAPGLEGDWNGCRDARAPLLRATAKEWFARMKKLLSWVVVVAAAIAFGAVCYAVFWLGATPR
jgi:hypothetical protein